MAACDYCKDGTDQGINILEDDDTEWVLVKHEDDYRPCLSDFEDKPKKGKKGKRLKDWE